MSRWVRVVERDGRWWWTCRHPGHEGDDPLERSRARARIPARTLSAAWSAGLAHARVHQDEKEERGRDV